MENVDKDYEIMDKGIKCLLKLEDYDAPTIAPATCTHISDGFIYEDNPVFTTLQCVKCNIQYDVLKATGQQI